MMGAWVEYRIPGDPEAGRGYVIGEPHYSNDWSHVVVADEDAHGMPINAAHCRVIAPRCDVADMRERYDRLYPGFLKPTTETQ